MYVCMYVCVLWVAGKYVPMGVGNIIPTSSIDSISDTMGIIAGVSSASLSTQTGE